MRDLRRASLQEAEDVGRSFKQGGKKQEINKRLLTLRELLKTPPTISIKNYYLYTYYKMF